MRSCKTQYIFTHLNSVKFLMIAAIRSTVFVPRSTSSTKHNTGFMSFVSMASQNSFECLNLNNIVTVIVA